MRELDIELWKTWKKSDLLKIEFPPGQIFSVSTIILAAFTLEVFAGFDHRNSTSKSMDQVPSYGSLCLHWRLSPHENLGRQKCQIFVHPARFSVWKERCFGCLARCFYEFYMKDGSLKHMMTWWCEFWKDQHRYPNATISFLYLASFTSIHSLLVRL